MMTATETVQRERLIKLGLCVDLARMFRACEHAEKRLGRIPDTPDELTSDDLAAISDTLLSKDEVNRVHRVFSLEDLRQLLPEEWQTRAEETADRMLARRGDDCPTA
jgi:hypothetical protein